MVKIVDRQTTNRVTDAALVLLDAAREAIKEAPDYRPGDPNATATLAMAVQALCPRSSPIAGAAWRLASGSASPWSTTPPRRCSP